MQSVDPLDDALAQHLNQVGMASPDEIEDARAVQRESEEAGIIITLGDALVENGVITEAIRQNVYQKLKQKGGSKGKTRKLGQYQLLKKLGEGGFGIVYLASDTMMKREVAVKTLHKQHTDDPGFLTRFKREARSAGNLNHENLCAAYAVGEEGGVHYYVMEYCKGEAIGDQLDREGSIHWLEATDFMVQAARGLQYAHENGFVHRDIKPDNLLYTEEGVVKILDMGLAKRADGSDRDLSLTQSGTAVGTPHYISPEQLKSAEGIDGRADIYSLGATFYHLVTGVTPFEGATSAAILMKHLTEQIPDPRDYKDDVPDGVAQVIRRMMAKEPADRYPSCKELLVDLELVFDGKPPVSETLEASQSSIAMPRVGPGARRSGFVGGMRPPVRGRATRPSDKRMEAPRRGDRRRTSGVREALGARTDLRDARRITQKPDSGKPVMVSLVLGGVLLPVIFLFAFGGGLSSGEANKTAKKGKKAPPSIQKRADKDEPKKTPSTPVSKPDFKPEPQPPVRRDPPAVVKPPPRNTVAPSPTGPWEARFNGRDLTDWRPHKCNPPVRNGAIILAPGDVLHSLNLKNYEIRGSFRIAGSGSGGIGQMRLHAAGGAQIATVAIDMHGKAWLWRGRQRTGPSGPVVSPRTWHRFHFRVASNTLTFSLDGKQVFREAVQNLATTQLNFFNSRATADFRLKDIEVRPYNDPSSQP